MQQAALPMIAYDRQHRIFRRPVSPPSHIRLNSSICNMIGPQVPWSWSDFFTIALMDPVIFSWAKRFIESSGCRMLLEEGASETCFTFCIPKKRPSENPLECLNALELSEAHTPQKQGLVSEEHSDLHLKRKFSKAPLVCTEVRRSNRLKSMSQGFKSFTYPPKTVFAVMLNPLRYPLIQ
jgi:hypothetical protein